MSTTIREIPAGLWDEIVNQADIELAGDHDAPIAAPNLDTARVSYWLEHRRRPPAPGQSFADVEYAGARVIFPVSFADRILAVARERLGVEADGIENPSEIIGLWLENAERQLRLGTPSAEPGDILVKLAAAEAWTFTVHGWQPLTPAGEQVSAAGVVAGWAAKASEARRDRLHYEENFGFLAGGICGQHGVFAGPACPACTTRRPAPFLSDRFVDEFLREGGGQGEADARRSFDAISELHTNADVLERVASVLAGDEDGGNDSPFYESIASARTFARALRYAATTIHKHTIR